MRTPQLADNLRRAVLQAAIEGKLNDRTNENARDLLAAIQTEKTAQQKTGKQKKNKPLAAISEEEIPFAIPENWVWVRLGDIADISSGATPDAKDLSKEGNIPYFKVSDMNAPENQKYMVKAENFLSVNAECKTIPINSIIYPKNGGALLTNKRRITTAECLIDLNTGYCAPIIVNVDYVYLWFFTVNFGDFYTGTAVPTVNAGTIKNLLIPLPPLTEQQQIVEKLNRLLNEIDSLKAQEQALITAQNAFPKKLRAALLQAAVQGELNERTNENARDLLAAIQAEKAALQKAGKLKKDKPLAAISEEEIPFTIPENWVWVRLGELLFQLTDGAHSTPKYTNQGVPFLSVKNISSGKISFEDTKFISKEEHLELTKRCKPEKGDILLSKVGTTGIPVLVKDDIEFSIFVSIALLKFSSHFICPQFLIYFIQSPLVQEQAKQNTRGVGNKNWVLAAIANTTIPLPPLSEQQQIVTKLEALLAEIDTLENAA